jgi:predicted nucleotidyltransferase
MKKREILDKLKIIKKELEKEGFVIEGVVGSFINAEKYNDIDIVYYLTPKFLERYIGFDAVNRIAEIKEYLEKEFNKKIDLIDKSYTNQIMKNVIKRGILNV